MIWLNLLEMEMQEKTIRILMCINVYLIIICILYIHIYEKGICYLSQKIYYNA